MAPGNSLDSQSAAIPGPNAQSLKLLPAVAIPLGILLGLCVMALAGHSHLTLVPSLSPDVPFGGPFLGSVVWGSAGLLTFFLLRSILGLVETARRNVLRRGWMHNPPPDHVAEVIEASLHHADPDGALSQPQLQSPDPSHSDLQYGSRFRTSGHVSGVRRSAIERHTDAAYAGPLRRATDRKASEQQHSNGLASDRRLGDRRSSSAADPIGGAQTTASPNIPEEARQHKPVSTDTSFDISHTQKTAGAGSAILPTAITRQTAAPIL